MIATSETLRAKLARKVARYKDARVYSQAEWDARNEPIGGRSLMTIVAEGELYGILNGHYRAGARDVSLERLTEWAQKHGLYIEQGYGWSWHFYPL